MCVTFARYHIIGNVWEQLWGSPYVPLRPLGLVAFSCSIRTLFWRLSSYCVYSFPLYCFHLYCLWWMSSYYFFVCTLLLLAGKSVCQHTFLLVGYWAARTTFMPYDIMIPVPGDELVFDWSALGRFSSGCLWYAKESIRSQHFMLSTEVFNWIMYLKMMLLNIMVYFLILMIRKDWHWPA